MTKSQLALLFERTEHARRSPAWRQFCTAVYTRPPCVPRSRAREKDPRPEKKWLPMSPKKCISCVYHVISHVVSYRIILSCACARYPVPYMISCRFLIVPYTTYQFMIPLPSISPRCCPRMHRHLSFESECRRSRSSTSTSTSPSATRPATCPWWRYGRRALDRRPGTNSPKVT